MDTEPLPSRGPKTGWDCNPCGLRDPQQSEQNQKWLHKPLASRGAQKWMQLQCNPYFLRDPHLRDLREGTESKVAV